MQIWKIIWNANYIFNYTINQIYILDCIIRITNLEGNPKIHFDYIIYNVNLHSKLYHL